jgi:hypothetical protein
VLIGIVDTDPESFRSVDPAWTPTLPAYQPGRFGLVDILLPSDSSSGSASAQR